MTPSTHDHRDVVDRLRVDLTAVSQRVRELDRRVTALHLLMAADDARHIEQGIIDAAGAATDLHKVTSVLGGSGLVTRLRARVDDVDDADLDAVLADLEDEIDATRRRVLRSSVLTRVASAELERQLGDVLGVDTTASAYDRLGASSAPSAVAPRLVDRLA